MDIPHVIAGRFCIECEIGKGGMGTVYRASHLGLERRVAVKILKSEFAAEPEVTERFMREARTMAKLRHPRAAMIFDAGRLNDGRPFIVMEHVEGQTLAQILARAQPFAPERAVRIAAQICDVLAEAHSLGIVHRDLKPSNIMLNERGVCVLDFGIAKVLATSGDVTRTHATTESGVIIGTPRYMSPEQCIGQKVGPASDLYSVGVLLYEMLAGHPPFVDQLPSAVLVKQATAAPPPLVALRPELPRSLALAVHTLLAKNPLNRPKHAAEARALLEKSIAGKHVSAELLPPPFAATLAALDAGRIAGRRSAALCAVLITLGGLLFALSSTARKINLGVLRGRGVVATTAAHAGGAGARVAASGSLFLPRTLSHTDAVRIAASASRGTKVREVGVVRSRRAGEAIAAIHEQRRAGTTHLYLMERRGGAFRVTFRTPLDVSGFRGADWRAEVVDIDGDGDEEVLCTGDRGRFGESFGRRFVLFVPRARQTYSLRVAPHDHSLNTVRAVWSSNIIQDGARPFRAALRRRALTYLPDVSGGSAKDPASSRALRL